MNEMELQTTLDPIEMDMGDPEIVYSPVFPNPEGEPTDDLTKVTIQGNIYQIKDPEVHDWARAEEKPAYTKAEVGLGNVDNTSDLDKPISTATQNALDGKVDNSELGNYYTKSEVNSALDNKADKSDTYTKTETDNLLSEKADSSSVYTKTETDTALGNKVDKVSGKGLSTNDYDDTAKGIVEGVTSALDNKVNKDGDKVLSDNNYSDTDKTKLDGIEAEANHTEVDTEISATSTNPLQNKAIYDLLNDLLPEVEETGNPISITNASGFNAKALTVNMLPIQDLHGYDKPWAGGSGKNKYPESVISGEKNGVTVTHNKGTYTLSGTATAYSQFISDDSFTLKAGTYNFTQFNGASGIYFQLRSVDGTTIYASSSSISTIQFTLENDTTVKARICVNGNVATNLSTQLMITESSTVPTSYEPYSNICPISGRSSLDVTVNGETETINLGETVYGGTSDVVGGGTSETYGVITLTDVNQLTGFAASQYGAYAFISGISCIGTSTLVNVICDKAIGIDYNHRVIDYNSYLRCYSDPTGKIAIRSKETDVVNTINDLFALFQGFTFVYKKVTPTTLTTPATPISLNKGNNTLSTSGDNMDLKYSTTISNPTSLSMGNPLSLSRPNLQTVVEHEVEEPTEETDER